MGDSDSDENSFEMIPVWPGKASMHASVPERSVAVPNAAQFRLVTHDIPLLSPRPSPLTIMQRTRSYARLGAVQTLFVRLLTVSEPPRMCAYWESVWMCLPMTGAAAFGYIIPGATFFVPHCVAVTEFESITTVKHRGYNFI